MLLFLTPQFRLLRCSRLILAGLRPPVLRLLPNSLPILLLLLLLVLRFERLLVLGSCGAAAGIRL